AWKVFKTGAGSALLKSPQGVAKIVSKLASAVSKPVTVKIRAGIDEKHINAVEVAKAVEDAGAAAIAVHGRTAKQGYSGKADWNLIKRVKESVGIPVIGNGDVFSPEIFAKRLEESGVDAILIARGAIGNPYIFSQIRDYLEKGSYDFKSPLEQFRDYLKFADKWSIGYAQLKQQAISFARGFEGSAKLRARLSGAKSREEVACLMDEAGDRHRT
ncbi:tRNA dihydrouridine synthase DusB, partial [Candidatus Woesearchaeota archaeon]